MATQSTPDILEPYYGRLAEANVVGMIHWTLDGPVLDANESFLDMLGYTRDDVASGRVNWVSLTPREFSERDAEKVAELRTRGLHGPYAKEYVHADGRRIPVLVASALLAGSEQLGVSLVVDQRAAREAHRRTEQLQQLSADLTRVLTRAEVVRVVVQHLINAFQAYAGGVVELSADATEFMLVGMMGYQSEVWDVFARHPVQSPVPIRDLVRTREPVFLCSVSEWVDRYGRRPMSMISDDGAWAALPLFVGDQLTGALTLSLPTPREFMRDDRAFMGAFADLCAQALERARLYDVERTARTRAEMLQRVTAVLARVGTTADVGTVFSREITTLLDADTAWVGTLDLTHRSIRALGHAGYSEEAASYWQELPLDSAVSVSDVVRTGVPQFWMTPEEGIGLYPARAAAIRAAAQSSVAVLPLTAEGVLESDSAERAGEVLGGIVIGFRTPQQFDADTRLFFLALAQQCGQAVARARAHEAELHALRVAESANQAKTQFLATMSHELRTPLNAIAGHAELMELGIHGPITEAQRDALGRIKRSQHHLLSLINEVLNYARLEAGVVRYDIADIPVGAALASVQGFVAPQVRTKGLDLLVDHCEESRRVRADEEKLGQVLLNLLSNAVKFTPAGGTIRVGCEEDGALQRITVADSGVGIAADNLERIFEPFVQVGRSLHRQSEGTGLGLAISRDLARGMGGELCVTSVLGSGSTFTLTLPSVQR